MWLKPFLWASWDCPSCGERLEFDPKRRFIVAVLSSILGTGPAIFCAIRGWLWGAAIAVAISVYLWRYDAIRICGGKQVSVSLTSDPTTGTD